jgi:hypothetical protein
MGGAWNTHMENEKCLQNFSGKNEKASSENYKQGENNIKIDLRETGCGVDSSESQYSVSSGGLL